MVDLIRNAAGIGDGPAVGAPAGAVVGPFPVGKPAHGGAGFGSDDINIGILVLVGVFGAVADKGDSRPVGAPDCRAFVEAAPGQGVDLFGGNIEEIKMGMDLLVAVSLNVLFVLIAVDHVWLGGLDLTAVFRIGVSEGEEDLFGVGAPGVIVDAPLDRGQTFGFPAAAVHQPDLAAFNRFGWLPRREKRNIAAVGAPACMGLAVGAIGELDILGSVPADHPDIGITGIFERVDRGEGIGDPF